MTGFDREEVVEKRKYSGYDHVFDLKPTMSLPMVYKKKKMGKKYRSVHFLISLIRDNN